MVRQLFKSFDADNSGEIDCEEMKGLLLGISLSTSDSTSLQVCVFALRPDIDITSLTVGVKGCKA